MTPAEFVNRSIGLPWIRWRSDWDGMDCYGLIVMYHREVLAIDLGDVPKSDIATGFHSATGWQECSAEDGATCFMAWKGDAPTHCGVLLPGAMVLHSEGSPEHPGSVRVTRLSVMHRAYGDLKFYKYAPC